MVLLHKIEALLLKEFEAVPFHNLFMLNNISIEPSLLGGTCSDKTLHFKKVLAENGINSTLHLAIINGIECHKMLSTIIEGKRYFIDVGSGWTSIKLFPAFEPIEYTVFGMTFKTEVLRDNIMLYHKTADVFNLMLTIPLQQKNEIQIIEEIERRFLDTSIYPFQHSLRFSIVKGEAFYFIKGNILKIFTSEERKIVPLSSSETFYWINNQFQFDLNGLKFNFP